jgi:serine O-acetyltransferase
MAEKLSQEQILKSTVEKLTTDDSLRHVCRCESAERPLPSQQAVENIIELSRALVFPGYYGDAEFTNTSIRYTIELNVERLQRLLNKQVFAALYMKPEYAREPSMAVKARAEEITVKFIAELPELREMLADDVEALYRGDPAATSDGEIILSYPAIRAITNHRVANKLHRLGVPVIPRMIAEHAHRETGIDIHPAATIGRAFMIDHGTGVVIGETAIIGDNVRIYQGVTLGARSFPTDEHNNPVKGLPRHPILGDNVIIYANSTILGRVTIGSDSVIGGNIWITDDVAPGSVVVQARAKGNVQHKKKQ